jgi:hypothetical protein
MGYGRGWATGTDVRSKPYTHIDDDTWNRIFKKGKYAKPVKKEANGNRSKVR